ncbi:hypothetical protein ACMFMG_009725 [Clarireedia jacksonii]
MSRSRNPPNTLLGHQIRDDIDVYDKNGNHVRVTVQNHTVNILTVDAYFEDVNFIRSREVYHIVDLRTSESFRDYMNGVREQEGKNKYKRNIVLLSPGDFAVMQHESTQRTDRSHIDNQEEAKAAPSLQRKPGDLKREKHPRNYGTSKRANPDANPNAYRETHERRAKLHDGNPNKQAHGGHARSKYLDEYPKEKRDEARHRADSRGGSRKSAMLSSLRGMFRLKKSGSPKRHERQHLL